MGLILAILLNGLFVYLGAQLLPGVFVEGYWSAVLAGVVLGLVNFFIKPLITFLTLPLTILTLGLFLIIINGLMILLVDFFVAGFAVQGLLYAILLSFFLAIVNGLLGRYEFSAKRK